LPYILEDRRTELCLYNQCPANPGELNYLITQRCIDYIRRFEPLNYQVYNDVIGALESAKLEFYRRAVVPYENTKIETNGDCY
jgi:hypothetical protein